MTETICKALGTVGPVEGDTSEWGEFDLILSTDALDRDGEVVEKNAMVPLPEHITMDVDHGMSVKTTVGSGVPSYDADGRLRVRGTYASTPLAQEVRALVNEGHIRTASVAYLPKVKAKGKNGEPTRTSKAELLNGAFVAIPSNREAEILVSKALQLKAGARNSTGDLELIQSAHDNLTQLGATCTTSDVEEKAVDPAQVKDEAIGDDLPGFPISRKSIADRAVTKSIVGSVEALQDRVSDALCDAYGSDYGYFGYLRGVIPSAGGGTVVFQSSRLSDAYGSETYRQSFTDDGSVATLTGTAEVVDIHEIVAPDADADREKGAAGIIPDEDPEVVMLRLRSESIRISGLASIGAL